MTRVCSPKVTQQLSKMTGADAGSQDQAEGFLPMGKSGKRRHRDEANHFARGHAFGADDIASCPRYVEEPAKTLFLVWVTLAEQKWVILGERRGSGKFV